MSSLFSSGSIGTLELPNRLVRSATAEFMADDQGRPKPCLRVLYQQLANGEVGLIITGHLYVHPSGKAHQRMTGVYQDDLVPLLAELAKSVHQERGRVVAQINHGGVKCPSSLVPCVLGPSPTDPPLAKDRAREMTPEEIETVIDAFAQAARRVKDAGFDGVQIHSAHGYLGSQFLSPAVNKRTDQWGGDIRGRMLFLKSVCQAVRDQVGPDYPVLTKLGMVDAVEGGLVLEDALAVVAELEDMGFDGLEITGGFSGEKESLNTRVGITSEKEEGYFRPIAKRARPLIRLPIILVGGFRSRSVMEDVLSAGDADFVSMCRPLVCEPDLPSRFRGGVQDKSSCVSGNRCWPEGPEDEGISCKCL